MMRKVFLIALLSLFCLNIIYSQTADKKFNLGLHGGLVQYSGTLGNGFLKFDQASYGFGGISFSTYLSPIWDLTASINMGEVGYHENETSFFRAQIVQYDVTARLKFLGDQRKCTPYFFIGLGATNFMKKYTVTSASSETAVPSAGVGFNLKITDAINFQFQEKSLYSITGTHDGENHGNGDGYFFHTIGLTYNMGKKKDTDGDGIADRLDKCPETPTGVKVSPDGCPVDTDGDGIADYLDECINDKGTEATKGCPDTDGDGIIDSKDECPDVAGLTEFNGCPDTDGDGITDKLDKCPTEKGLKQFGGCPDSDNDGIADKDDKCANTPLEAKVDGTGCPLDADGDGIADYLDKCPSVAGLEKNAGCPEVKEEVKQVFKQALQGIQFAIGKDVILKKSFPILDKVVKILNDNPQYNLMINGHSDNQGKPASNKQLSQKRAEAVKAYLVKKGIAANRLTATGYGDTKPIADNKTPAGRTQNRRVELVVEF